MIVFFSFVFIVFSILLGKLTIWQNSKIIIDFWLAMIEVFGLLWVLFVWSQLLFKEIDWKTIFLILSKPIKRYEFLFWKVLGFSLTIFLIILVEVAVFLWVLFYQWISIENLIIWSIINTFLKLEITLAIVFFLSTFMSNMLTIATTLLIYILAHSYSIILDLVHNWGNEVLIYTAKLWWLLFPPFEALNTKDIIWAFSNFSLGYFLSNWFYSVAYFVILLLFAILIFNRKKFET
jgi:ABC-type transport system involved in multi-copper enzyme maturation permease subunit